VYELLGISLVLAALLSINALASLAVTAGWRSIQYRLQNVSAGTRAEILFAMRVGPPLLALILVTVFLVPSYIGYEPYGTGEIVSKKLGALAILSAIGVGLAFSRAFRSWLATRRLLRDWLAGAAPVKVKGANIPAFRIDNAFPIIAVVGTFRPRLFIAESVIHRLTEDELAAALAHERGHLRARDNFKRSLLRGCRDMLMIVPCGRALDQAWSEAAEAAADEQAALESAETALNLASALVKVAKMVPVGSRAAVPLAAFLVGVEETRGVKARVRRLLEMASNGYLLPARNPAFARLVPAVSFCCLLLLAFLIANNQRVLIIVHNAIESAVRILS
jgi:Zn-dependent protease with chaperone function